MRCILNIDTSSRGDCQKTTTHSHPLLWLLTSRRAGGSEVKSSSFLLSMWKDTKKRSKSENIWSAVKTLPGECAACLQAHYPIQPSQEHQEQVTLHIKSAAGNESKPMEQVGPSGDSISGVSEPKQQQMEGMCYLLVQPNLTLAFYAFSPQLGMAICDSFSSLVALL